MSTSAMWRPASWVVAIRPSRGSSAPPRWRADPPPPARRSRATLGWRVGPVSGRQASGLKPVAVAPEVQRAQLLARLSDQVAFADQDLVGIPRQRLALAAVAPARDRAASAARPKREILEAHDFGDGRAAVVGGGHRDWSERTGVRSSPVRIAS